MVNHQLVIKGGIKGSRVSNPPALMARDADYMTFLVLSQSHPTRWKIAIGSKKPRSYVKSPIMFQTLQVYEFLKAVTVSSPKNISAQQQGKTGGRGGLPNPWAFSDLGNM